MSIVNSILPIIILLGAGYGIKHTWLKDEMFWKTINSLIYYLMFPVLMVKSITLADFSGISYDFIIVLIAIVLLFIAGIWLLKPLFRQTAFWVVFAQGAVRYNSFIFIPVTYLYVGQGVAPIIALITACLVMTTNIISVYLLNLYGQKSKVFCGMSKQLS